MARHVQFHRRQGLAFQQGVFRARVQIAAYKHIIFSDRIQDANAGGVVISVGDRGEEPKLPAGEGERPVLRHVAEPGPGGQRGGLHGGPVFRIAVHVRQIDRLNGNQSEQGRRPVDVIRVVVREDQRVDPFHAALAEPIGGAAASLVAAGAAAVDHGGEGRAERADALPLPHVQRGQRKACGGGLQPLQAHGGNQRRQQAEQGKGEPLLPQREQKQEQAVAKDQAGDPVAVGIELASWQRGHGAADPEDPAHDPGQEPARPATQRRGEQAERQHGEASAQTDGGREEDQQIGQQRVDRHRAEGRGRDGRRKEQRAERGGDRGAEAPDQPPEQAQQQTAQPERQPPQSVPAQQTADRRQGGEAGVQPGRDQQQTGHRGKGELEAQIGGRPGVAQQKHKPGQRQRSRRIVLRPEQRGQQQRDQHQRGPRHGRRGPGHQHEKSQYEKSEDGAVPPPTCQQPKHCHQHGNVEAGHRKHVGGSGQGRRAPVCFRQAAAVPGQHGAGQTGGVCGQQRRQPRGDAAAEPDGKIAERGVPVRGFQHRPRAGQQNAAGQKVEPGLAVRAAVGAAQGEGPGDPVARLQLRQRAIEIEPGLDPRAVEQNFRVGRVAVGGLGRKRTQLGLQALIASLGRPRRPQPQRVAARAPKQPEGKSQTGAKHAPRAKRPKRMRRKAPHAAGRNAARHAEQGIAKRPGRWQQIHEGQTSGEEADGKPQQPSHRKASLQIK